jgi:hypothetical protein
VNSTEKVASAALPLGLALVARRARSVRRATLREIDNPQHVMTPVTGHLAAKRADQAEADGGRRRVRYPQDLRAGGSWSRDGWLCRAVRPSQQHRDRTWASVIR